MTDKVTVRPVYPEDWALKLEADFDEYMDALYEQVDADPFDEDHNDDSGIDVTGEYFCGCSVCHRRAEWTWLMIKVIQAHQDGIVTLEPVGDPS
jgi:hypothetical protein